MGAYLLSSFDLFSIRSVRYFRVNWCISFMMFLIVGVGCGDLLARKCF